MFELNVVTAVPIGALAAAVWAAVSIRRMLRSPKFQHFTGKQRFAVWGAGAIAFLPSLFIAFAASVALSGFTVHPGPWNHLALSLTVVFGLGLLGAAITWVSARLAATLIRGRKGHA